MQAALVPHGLICRGGFHPDTSDGAPAGIQTLILVGNAGPMMWQAFTSAMRVEPNPLDAWTERILGDIADDLGATPLFPFDGPPYYPFQHWAMRAESVHVSPIGPLIHPEFGLWHAYRGAMAFQDKLKLPPLRRQPSPCRQCKDRPCLSACPVDALTDGAYDTVGCRTYLSASAGERCMSGGCMARQACPIGREFFYDPPQARLHMEAFRDAAPVTEPPKKR